MNLNPKMAVILGLSIVSGRASAQTSKYPSTARQIAAAVSALPVPNRKNATKISGFELPDLWNWLEC